jgi:hypothetical protein
MMRDDTIEFQSLAARFLFGRIGALANPAEVCLQADLRQRAPAGGRSKLMRDDWAAHPCSPEARGVAIQLGGGRQFCRLNRDEQGE